LLITPSRLSQELKPLHYFRLHPFSVAEALELANRLEPGKEPVIEQRAGGRDLFEQLLMYGGFPEPFLKADTRSLRRWHNQRIERLAKEDIRDIETIRDLSALQLLMELLPRRVASLLSLNALREDLSVAHKTITLWMDILERFYYHSGYIPLLPIKSGHCAKSRNCTSGTGPKYRITVHGLKILSHHTCLKCHIISMTLKGTG